jgi:hypothetical protein
VSELKEANKNEKQESKRTVFISYSRSDADFVKGLAGWLQEAGCTVWQDTSGVRGGQTWATGIQQAVSSSDVMIVVLSPDSVASEWVRKETLLAMNLRKPIVPLLFRETEIPVQLVDIQFVDFRGDKEKAARALFEAIANSADSPTVSYKPFRPRRYGKILPLSILGAIIFATIIYVTATQIKRLSQIPSDSKDEGTTLQNSNGPMKSADNTALNTDALFPKEMGVYIANSSEKIPVFAAVLSGFKSEEGKDFWGNKFDTSGSIRVFQDQGWDGIPEFPNTQSGCSAGVFMIRWRSANPEVVIASTMGYSAEYAKRDENSTSPKLSSFGFMVGTNCEQPLFKFSATRNGNESNLVDIYYELKFWQAAP